MRTTEIFTAIATIIVLIIMRSKAESFLPFSSIATQGSKGTKPKGKNINYRKGKNIPKYYRNPYYKAKTDAQRQGLPAPKWKSDAIKDARQSAGSSYVPRKNTPKYYSNPYYKASKKPVTPSAGSPVPGRPGAVFGKRGGIASRSSYERKFGTGEIPWAYSPSPFLGGL